LPTATAGSSMTAISSKYSFEYILHCWVYLFLGTGGAANAS
jgi:hypothetical protein